MLVEEPNCFSFVLRDSILSVGLQTPKPQLAADSACREECEGLLMVTPSLAVLGAKSHAAALPQPRFYPPLFFTNKHVHPQKYAQGTEAHTCEGRAAQSMSWGLEPLLFFEQ